MTRVSDNSGKFALNFAINKAKQKLEDLQLKGSSLKKITKPSDDPVSNLEYLTIGNRMSTNEQFTRNINYAQMYLEYTEDAIEDLTDIMVKAKELAIAQSSDLYNDDVRKNIAKEVEQLQIRALSVGNRRLGNKYIFGGFNTLTQPFDMNGKYQGDQGRISVEISKDFFIPINLHGAEVFFSEGDVKDSRESPLAPFPEMRVEDSEKETPPIENPEKIMGGRELASLGAAEKEQPQTSQIPAVKRDNVFTILGSFVAALESADSDVVKDLLEEFDSSIDRLVTMRTRIGAIHNSVTTTASNLEQTKVNNASQRSKLADADVAELYSDLVKQQHVLQATYKSGQNILNKSLLDFLR